MKKKISVLLALVLISVSTVKASHMTEFLAGLDVFLKKYTANGQVNYSAAKAGIIGATKALAVELARRKITVNCVAPGVIETDMAVDIHHDEAMKMIPMRRFGKPEDIAATVAFLVSDAAGYLTRQVISVNGGMC